MEPLWNHLNWGNADDCSEGENLRSKRNDRMGQSDHIRDGRNACTDAEYVAALAYVNSEYTAALTELEV